MKRMVIFLKSLRSYLDTPILLVSFAALFITLTSPSGDVLPLLFSFLMPSYYTYYALKSARYGMCAGISVASGNLLLLGITGEAFSVVMTVVLSVFVCFLMKKLRYPYSGPTAIAAVLLIAFFMTRLFDLYLLFLHKTAVLFQDSAAVYGVIENVFSLFCSERFRDTVLTTDASAAALIGGRLVSGAKNIFLADAGHSAVAAYLTGRYYESIFVTLGAAILLLIKLPPQSRLPLFFLSVYTVLCGDVRLFSLYVLVYNPLLYLVLLAGAFLSYLLPPLLSVAIGYEIRPSVTELFRYMDKPFYFFISGLVLALLVFYLCRIVLVKFDFQQEPYYPASVRRLLKSLGGRENIESITEDKLYVKNPNLINLLNLECDIRQNEVTLYEDDLTLLKKYN